LASDRYSGYYLLFALRHTRAEQLDDIHDVNDDFSETYDAWKW